MSAIKAARCRTALLLRGIEVPSVWKEATVASAPALWVHAASVGELTAVRPLLVALRDRFPGRVLVVSTLTRTGLALAQTMPEPHLALLFPLDADGPVDAVLDRVRLEAFLFTETEVWPTFLARFGGETPA